MGILKKKIDIKLPSSYCVSENNHLIIVSYIKEFWLDNKSYTDSIYYSDFKNRNDFEYFLYENFKKIYKIKSSTTQTSQIYILNNGLLHNNKSYSYLNNDNKYYFIHGKEFSEKDFYIYIREQKLLRILEDDN